MTEPIKRPRGRPKLSEEEKARRREERKAKKVAPVTPKPTVSPQRAAEADEIRRITEIMAKADELKRQQMVTPVVKVEPQGSSNIITIALSKEINFEDEPKDSRPDFVQDDEKGWEDPA